MDLFSLWTIFSLSFIVALTGAITPGPLFTYTIIKSIQANSKKNGIMIGIWVVLGHAILEFILICLILYGFSNILNQPYILIIIGIIGGTLLCFLGSIIIRDVKTNKIDINFFDKPEKQELNNKKKEIANPVLGGALVSMLNPYWWFWWAVIGFAFMVEYNISFQNIDGFIVFFLGHELGDLIWYLLIAIFVSYGRKKINQKIYYRILLICGLFMICFGLYLGISPIVDSLH